MMVAPVDPPGLGGGAGGGEPPDDKKWVDMGQKEYAAPKVHSEFALPGHC